MAKDEKTTTKKTTKTEKKSATSKPRAKSSPKVDARPEKKAIALVPEGDSGVDIFNKMDKDQLDLIKATVAKDATDDELKMFLQVCAGAQLNPFLKQVHFIKRWNSAAGKKIGTIQVGIDGFRAIAESSGQYAGSDDAVMRDEKEVKMSKGETVTAPGSATVTVHKLMKGERFAFTATARWREYYPGEKNDYMWKKMPFGQLAKCAEALALRKAFPKLLSGLYAPEEMDQASGGQTETAETGGDEKPKENPQVEKLLQVISKQKDLGVIEDFRDKVKGSDKFNEKEKTFIYEAMNEKCKALLDGDKPATPEDVKEVLGGADDIPRD